KRAIDAVVREKREWIRAAQKKAALRKTAPVIPFELGDTLFYFGKAYATAVAAVTEITVEGDRILFPSGSTRRDALQWIAARTARYINDKLPALARQIGARYTSVALSSARTRWGTCSGTDALRFNRRLAMCPAPVFDYILIHELCHIEHKNHSPAFWAKVEKYDPNRKAARVWLREHNYFMQKY
ncbi:MAG: M48 family metallopeptidase, partial [Clostridiales bacterium]|nr:M48 family metallopeptidase [Clostridiales bacterium]